MSSCILALNAGSTSLKFGLFHIENLTELARGGVNQIGTGKSRLEYWVKEHRVESNIQAANHEAALDAVLGCVQRILSQNGNLLISAIGHRVVQGGEKYSKATRINQDLIIDIESLAGLAPLHNPINLLGINLCCQRMPDIPQVAVFDTAFHQSMPEHAYRYAIPESFYKKHSVRRYGFHGISHHYICSQTAKQLHKPVASTSLISLHLGAGASICAIQNGQCVDTSMGMTPLVGLMMATRCGDIDPSILPYLVDKTDASVSEIMDIFNHHSGIKGISGISDMQDLIQRKNSGDSNSKLAFEMFSYQARKYIGSYYAVLNNVDAIVFTGGIGENSSEIREAICQNLSCLGIIMDLQLNQKVVSNCQEIQSPESTIKIFVIKTNEALQIARETKMQLDACN